MLQFKKLLLKKGKKKSIGSNPNSSCVILGKLFLLSNQFFMYKRDDDRTNLVGLKLGPKCLRWHLLQVPFRIRHRRYLLIIIR